MRSPDRDTAFAGRTRLRVCARELRVWQPMVELRAMALQPHEQVETWIKFGSLCRKSGRLELTRTSLSKLLPPGGPLTSLPVVFRGPRRCLPALCTFWLPIARLFCMLLVQLAALRRLLQIVVLRVVCPRCCSAPVALARRLRRCCCAVGSLWRGSSEMERSLMKQFDANSERLVELTGLESNLDRV